MGRKGVAWRDDVRRPRRARVRPVAAASAHVIVLHEEAAEAKHDEQPQEDDGSNAAVGGAHAVWRRVGALCAHVAPVALSHERRVRADEPRSAAHTLRPERTAAGALPGAADSGHPVEGGAAVARKAAVGASLRQ